MKLNNKMWKKRWSILLCVWLIGGNLVLPGQAAWEEIFDEGTLFETGLKDNFATNSNATQSNARFLPAGTGDLWKNWTSTDYRFLDGTKGNGTRENPYQIQNKAHLRAFTQLASLGMVIGTGSLESDLYAGDYAGDYFELTGDINLGGMEWIPIGFYQNEAEMTGPVPHPFRGHFNGNGYTISNYRMVQPTWNYLGLFGVVEDSSIENLNVQISDTMTGGTGLGILAGMVKGTSEIRGCAVKGNVRGRGLVGGVVGYFAGNQTTTSVIEDCKANVTLDSLPSDNGHSVSVGGIAGQADRVTIIDCEVETADNTGARIQGKGFVGGITGWQNDANLYNVLVASGTIGGNGATAIGGVTGYYTSGDIKVARMSGTIGSSGLGSYAHEGIFIGNKGSGCNFTYGVRREDDMAYLFTDSEAKLNIGACGSDVPDDNHYTYQAHIGFWHSGDLYSTLRQGNYTRQNSEQYFYEVLEQGILHVLDDELGEEEIPVAINHIAADATGRPKRGYLISIPQIDTVANGRHFYDVAVLTASGSGAYCRPLDKEKRGAVAEGSTVTVATSPKNTNQEKYQMDGVPFYWKNGGRKMTSYITGGQYTFTMPANDTEVSAVYRRVAADVRVNPVTYSFKVVQTRTGSRKSPTLTTVVMGDNGMEIARYVNGTLEGAQVLPIAIQKTVDANNDVFDSRVKWSIDNSNLIRLLNNDDTDATGYTDKSAGIQVRLDSPFFRDILNKQEQIQTESGYRYAIPPTIYGAGHAGAGIAILTAATRNSESFEGKPCTAQSRIQVTFQILDQTYVDIESVKLSQDLVGFTVTRTLTGNRNAPTETIQVSPSQALNATFFPDYFSKKEVAWTLEDSAIATLFTDAEEYRSIRIEANPKARWIGDIIAEDRMRKTNNPQEKVSGSGVRETSVTIKADDKNGNHQVANGTIRVNFITVDLTGAGSASGGGGSSGGGGGGGTSTGITAIGTTKASAQVPGYVVTGTWLQNAAGKWLFTDGFRAYVNEWAAVYNPYAKVTIGQDVFDWFRFDGEGFLMTGWFTDGDGNDYYLNPISDGTLGRVITGWHVVDGKRYFFNENSNGVRGALLKNTVTPDGSRVNESGIEIY